MLCTLSLHTAKADFTPHFWQMRFWQSISKNSILLSQADTQMYVSRAYITQPGFAQHHRRLQQALLQANKEQQQHAGDCGAEQRQRRSTRTKAVPAHVLESAALISDSELEEQTESDTEFMAGTKKVLIFFCHAL